MKVLLLLLAITELSWGLQGSLHYTYKYFGSIFSGVPEISPKSSGGAMKADVHVFIEKDDGTAFFQLQHIEIAEIFDGLGCDSRGELPKDAFHEIADPDMKQALESPFRVNLFGHEDLALEYSESKYNWLPNVLKGIVSIFRNEILKGNTEHQVEKTVAKALHDGHVINVFSVMEESLFGLCQTEYTVHPIPEHLTATIRHELDEYIEEDVQSDTPQSSSYTSKTSRKTTSKKYTSKTSRKTYSKTSKTPSKYRKPDAPELEDKLWHVVKSVNFDHCDELVGFQIDPFSYKREDGNQHEWIKSRSSVSEFIFRGAPGHARLEKAIVEGSNTLMPYAFKTDALQARVNQTFHLVKVVSGTSALPVLKNPKTSNTWMHEIFGFLDSPKLSQKPHWIVPKPKSEYSGYLAPYGLDPYTTDEINTMKELMKEKIEFVSLVLTDLDQEKKEPEGGAITQYITDATLYAKFLTKEQVLEVFDYFFKKDLHQHDTLAKKLVVDTAAASGTFYAYDAILDYIKAGKIPDLQIATIFMTIYGNADTPVNAHSLMEYVLSLKFEEKPLLTSTVLVNFAKFLGQLCLNPSATETKYAGAMFGDLACNEEIVKPKFLPYLEDLIKGEHPDWQKIVAIKALQNLETPISFIILSPVIEGTVVCSSEVRLHAIKAFEGWSLRKFGYWKKPVLDLLNDVYSDIAERPDVREAALFVASSWNPEPNFWFRLARISWREPSRRFASYITSLIQTFATNSPNISPKEQQVATHALKLARPVAPVFEYSHSFTFAEESPSKHFFRFLHGQWTGSKSKKDGRGINFILMPGYGGFEFADFDFDATIFGIEKYLNSIKGEKEETRAEGIAARIAEDFYSRVQETIRSEKISDTATPKPSVTIFMSLFNYLQAIVPLNEETIKSVYNPTRLAELVLQFSMGYDLVLAKYFKPFDMKFFYPSEVGMPLMSSVSTPILISDVTYSTLTIENPEDLKELKNIEGKSEILSSLYFGMTTTFAVIFPWNKNFYSAGVIATREVVAPYNVVVKKERKEEGGNQDIIRVDIENQYKKTFTPIRASSKSFLGKFNSRSSKERNGLELVPIYQIKPVFKEASIPSTYTGIDLSYTWESEFPSPFDIGFFQNFITDCSEAQSPWVLFIASSRTPHYWNFELKHHPETSKTKKISFEFMIATFGEASSQITDQFTQERGGTFEQYGQGSYDDYGQGQSFDYEQGLQELGGTQEVETIPQVQTGKSLTEISQKMQEYFGGPVKSHSLSVKFTGEETRGYEFIHSFSKTKSGDKKLKKIQISLSRTAIPHLDAKPSAICVDIQKALPVFSKLDTAETILNSNIERDLKLDVTLGCAGEPILTLKGKNYVSDQWKEKYTSELPHSCNFNPEEPVHTLLRQAAYDHLSYDVSWEQVCDTKHYPLTSQIFGLAEEALNVVLPHEFCSYDTNERNLSIKAHRCPLRGTWYVDIEKGNSELHLKSLPHDFVAQSIYELKSGLSEPQASPEHISVFNTESQTCVVGINHVRTFDGFTYDFEASQCWTVAAKDCHVEDGKMLLVRSSQGELNVPDLRYIDVSRGLVIDYINNRVTVNGKQVDPIGDHEVVENNEGQPLVTIYKKNDYYMIYFSSDFYILAKDKVYVHAPGNLHGVTCGLCGNNDGEQEAELVGPHRCYYDDPKLFAASWTAGSDTCNLYSLLELREPVDGYQRDCKTIEHYQSSCPHFNHRCMNYGWMVKTLDKKVCVSESPLLYCSDTCNFSEFVETVVSFKCWPNDAAPDILTTAVTKNELYINTALSYVSPFPHIPIHLSLPSVCKSY